MNCDPIARAYRWLETWLQAEGEPPGVTLITCGRGRRTLGAGAAVAVGGAGGVSVVVLIRFRSAAYSAASWVSSFLTVLAR